VAGFFSKTDNRPKTRFFKFAEVATTEDTSASSGVGVLRFGETSSVFSHHKFRLVRSKETLEELLEKLLINAEKSDGLARSHYLEQLLQFLTRNPKMVNHVRKDFHSNPLELVIKLGDMNVAKQLCAMHATVRPEYRSLLKHIELFLPSKNLKEKVPSFKA
jgi:hypothetical protein